MVVEHELILSINKLLPSVKFINVFEDHLISVRSHQSISITRESCFLEYHQRSTLYDFQCRPLYYGRHRRLSEYFHHYGLTGRSIAIYLGTNEREIDFLHVRRWIYRWCLFFKKQIVRKKNENFIRRWRTRRKCKKTIQSILFFFRLFPFDRSTQTTSTCRTGHQSNNNNNQTSKTNYSVNDAIGELVLLQVKQNNRQGTANRSKSTVVRQTNQEKSSNDVDSDEEVIFLEVRNASVSPWNALLFPIRIRTSHARDVFLYSVSFIVERKRKLD